MIPFRSMNLSAAERWEAHARAWRWPIWAATGLIALALAWISRFVQDDAFISFVYARNLVNGEGLTWFGTRVEGYTNFLWTIWIAAGLKAGVEPVAWAHLGSMLSFVLVLTGLWRLARSLFGTYLPALLSVILLSTNYTVLAYATGGLETMTQAALLTWSAVLCERLRKACPAGAAPCAPKASPAPAALALSGPLTLSVPLALSLLLALACLTRPDSALPAAILGAFALWQAVRLSRGDGDARSGARAIGPLIALALPFLVLMGGYALWKVGFYGRLLPNAYYAKLGDGMYLAGNGLLYLWRFLHAYLLWPVLAAGLAGLWLRRRHLDRRLLGALALYAVIVLAWLAYIVAAGGDFMEFRMLVPVAPFLFLLVAYLVWFVLGEAWMRRPLVAALASLLLLGSASLHHARSFTGMTGDEALDSIHTLGTFYGRYPDGDWTRLGRYLKRNLEHTDAVLATTAAGAIPFYSDLRTIDQWGLNDLEIPRHGNRAEGARRPGHRRHATLSYLRAQGVNLIIGHPQIVKQGQLSKAQDARALGRWLMNLVRYNREPLGEATVVAMPLDRGEALLMWYLTPSPAIDRAIERQGWESAVVSF